MPSKTDQLKDCIAANEEYTTTWPWNPDRPLDSLPWYAVWLGRQLQLVESVSESDDKDFYLYFCAGLNRNGNLDLLNRYLVPQSIPSFQAYRQKILHDLPEGEKENLLRLYRIWIQDQYELMNNSSREGLIAKTLGADDRKLLRENLADLERIIADSRDKAEDASRKSISLSDYIGKEIQNLDLPLDPKNTSTDRFLKEINSRIKQKRAEDEKLARQSEATAVPAGFRGNLQSYKNMVHARSELLQGQIRRLEEIQRNVLTRRQRIEDIRAASAEVDREGEKGIRETTDSVRKHIDEFSKGKKALDPYLATTREGAKTEMTQKYAQLMPLLQDINTLNNKILMMKDPGGYLADEQVKLDEEIKEQHDRLEERRQRLNERRELAEKVPPSSQDARQALSDHFDEEERALMNEEYQQTLQASDRQDRLDEGKRKALDAAIKAEEQKLADLHAQKDQLFLRIGYLQQKVDTVKTAYEEQIADERQFEEEAKHQLKLLKTIRRVDHALNLYCSWYKDSFPLFLYIGSFVRGDGDIIQSPSMLGKAMDVLTKLPMVGAGLTDIEKCRAFDTGSMVVSLKLGLSLGGDVKAATATAGLAVEYNAKLAVADDRTFATTAQFSLKAAAGVDIKTFHHFALELEIASWMGGFVFQDHYHWAAWLAARWGHFCARSRACDDYLHSNNLEPDHKPSPKAMAELDRLTTRYLSDNEMIQTVWKEIKQYLDYPVIQSEQAEFFSQGKLQVGLLGVGLETSGNIRDAHPEMYVMRDNGKGEMVRYEARYTTRQGGGKITVGTYNLEITDSDTDGCPITLNDGEIITIKFNPLPAPGVWVTLFDLMMGLVSGTGDISPRFVKLLKEVTKWATQNLLKKYAADYLLGKVKTLEASFYVSLGEPVLQYIRTSVDYGKDFTAKIPAYAFVYVDVGASFHFVRTFGEVLGRNSINYPQYVHYGFKGIPRQTPPEDGKKVYTLRPDGMSGEELWKKYVEAHKHELWHMFMAIGEPDNNTLIRRELAKFHNTALAHDLVSICEQKRQSGKYQLTAEALIPFVTGFLGPQGQVVVTLTKHATAVKNAAGYEQVSADYGPILKVFNDLLDDEYRHIRSEEMKSDKFKPVPQKGGNGKAGQVFDARDDRMLIDTYDAQQLHEETGKCLKSCEKCLSDQKSYDLARELLLQPVIPEKYWMDDRDASTCMACHLAIKPGMFGITNKHHCRICGGVFCDKCCTSTTVSFSKSKLRVCSICQTRMSAALGGAGPKMPFDLPRSKPKAVPKVSPPPVTPVKTTGPPQPQSLVKTTSAPQGGTAVSGQTPPPQSLMGSGKPTGLSQSSLMGSGKQSTGASPQPQAKSPAQKPAKQDTSSWDQELYTDDHINFLLEHYLAGQADTYVFHCMDAHQLSGNALRTNLDEARRAAFAQGRQQMVVPVNIHGGHWVGVYLHFATGNYFAPTIIHVDPYGNTITADLSGTLRAVFPQSARPQEIRTRYQNADDKVNCGPWTVAIMEHMAKTHGTLPKQGAIDIHRQRTKDYQTMWGDMG